MQLSYCIVQTAEAGHLPAIWAAIVHGSKQGGIWISLRSFGARLPYVCDIACRIAEELGKLSLGLIERVVCEDGVNGML